MFVHQQPSPSLFDKWYNTLMKEKLFFITLFSGVIFFGDMEAVRAATRILIVPGHDNEYWGTDYRI